MSVGDNVSFWKQKSEIDYIPLFIFLWFALNSWMRGRFVKERTDRGKLEMIKSSGGPLLSAFSDLIQGPGPQGKLFRSAFEDLHHALIDAYIPYDESRWPNRIVSFECCVINWNNGRPHFESILIKKEEGVGEGNEDLESRIELNDDLWIEDDPERLFAAYMEIVYQIRCSLFHEDLARNPEDSANKRVIRQLYLTLSMVMEDIE